MKTSRLSVEVRDNGEAQFFQTGDGSMIGVMRTPGRSGKRFNITFIIPETIRLIRSGALTKNIMTDVDEIHAILGKWNDLPTLNRTSGEFPSFLRSELAT